MYGTGVRLPVPEEGYIRIMSTRNGKYAALGVVALATLAPAGARAQDINVTVDGDVIQFVGQKPIQRFGTVLVPLRGVFERLGANVAYDGATRTILAVKGATSVSLKLGSSQAQVNGETRTLSLPAQSIGGSTLVPLRFVSEALGADVAWRGASRTVVISTSGVADAGTGGEGTPQPPPPTKLADRTGPTLGSLSPASGAALPPGKPLIYGTLSDAGSGVDAAGTRLLLNGRDVSAQATITDAFFSYRPTEDLPLGRNTVTVLARDAAGNDTRREWAFTVSAAEALIQELTYSPQGQTLEPGDVINVRLRGKPGGRARFSIGGVVVDRPLREGEPGVYTGNYTVRKGDSLAKAPITASLTLAGRTTTQTADQALNIAAGAPDRPTITSPQAGAAVGESLVLRGKAAPNATVRYRVDYRGVLLIVPAGGTVAEGEVKANASGDWVTPEIRIGSAPSGVRNVTYTATVAVVGAAGEQSETASVEFKK